MSKWSICKKIVTKFTEISESSEMNNRNNHGTAALKGNVRLFRWCIGIIIVYTVTPVYIGTISVYKSYPKDQLDVASLNSRPY